jgi:hypothetical protein
LHQKSFMKLTHRTNPVKLFGVDLLTLFYKMYRYIIIKKLWYRLKTV